MQTEAENFFEDNNICLYCQEVIENNDVKSCDCKKLQCPVCEEIAWNGQEFSLANLTCGHLLAGKEDDEFTVSLLEKFSFPILNNTKLSKYTDTELSEVLGESYPLLKAYNQDLFSEIDENGLWEVLTQLVSGLEVSDFYDQHPASMLGWEANMLCAQEPLAANKRIAQLINLFGEKINFLRLEKNR